MSVSQDPMTWHHLVFIYDGKFRMYHNGTRTKPNEMPETLKLVRPYRILLYGKRLPITMRRLLRATRRRTHSAIELWTREPFVP